MKRIKRKAENLEEIFLIITYLPPNVFFSLVYYVCTHELDINNK